MGDIKTLSTCSEVEFLRQTNKIRKAVEQWLTKTNILNIRKRIAEFQTVPKDATKEEKFRIAAENKEREAEQVKKNLNDMLDAMLEEYPEETVKVMKLCCFVDPEDTTSHHITYYMGAFAQMLGDENVIGFFQSLILMAQRFGLKV